MENGNITQDTNVDQNPTMDALEDRNSVDESQKQKGRETQRRYKENNNSISNSKISLQGKALIHLMKGQ